MDKVELRGALGGRPRDRRGAVLALGYPARVMLVKIIPQERQSYGIA